MRTSVFIVEVSVPNGGEFGTVETMYWLAGCGAGCNGERRTRPSMLWDIGSRRLRDAQCSGEQIEHCY